MKRKHTIRWASATLLSAGIVATVVFLPREQKLRSEFRMSNTAVEAQPTHSVAPALSTTPDVAPHDQGVVQKRMPEPNPLERSAAAMFPDTPAGRRLRAHWIVANTPKATLVEAEGAHAASLAELRRDAAESARLLGEAYEKLPEMLHESRFVVAMTLGELDSPHAVESLKSIATAQVPPERYDDTHHASSQGDERIIRMVAVDGLAMQAKGGNRAAESELFAIAIDPALAEHASVRIRAIKGYVAAGPDTKVRAEALRPSLPTELYWALEPGEPTREEVVAHMPPGENL
jgi:hypothetical protein